MGKRPSRAKRVPRDAEEQSVSDGDTPSSPRAPLSTKQSTPHGVLLSYPSPLIKVSRLEDMTAYNISALFLIVSLSAVSES